MRTTWSLALLAACAAPAGDRGPRREPARAMTHVACIGDSITAGYAASTPDAAYPAALQRLVGPTVTVGNFGHLGATLLAGGDIAYVAQPEYAAARSFIATPGATVDVVIELGANDARPPNWQGSATAAAFARDYDALIDKLAAAPTHPRLFLAIPLAVTPGNPFDIDDGVLATQLAPLIAQIAARHHLPVIDLRTPAIARGDDGVHPTDAGYAALAEAVRTAIAAS